MSRNFDDWFSKFKVSIAGYSYYVDFPKVIKNVERIKIELNILNSLIGSQHIERDFEDIIMKYPETLKCIPILLAVRLSEIHAQDEDGSFSYRFDSMNYSLEQYKVFCRKTGLFDLISNHMVNNLVDYALGIETGLDSHARKSRGGTQMENLVENYIKKAGFILGENYLKESYLQNAVNAWGVVLPALAEIETARKRLDFIVNTGKQIYGIETNFYAVGGSKLNETARSYQLLGQQSQEIDGFTFVWITDGFGWCSAKPNLKETFNSLPTLFNINELENGILEQVLL